MNNNTSITIVTVCYNAVTTIEQTILSVINQTFTNIEYIIIDGGSIDGTIDIIKKYAKNISVWISEPDKGIYDAMNKGIELATGQWINFMNSGDLFYNSNTLNNIFGKKIINADIIYGDRLSRCSFGEFYHKVDSLDKFNKFFPLFHQSIFIKTEVAKKNKFDLKYKICADYNQMYQLYKNNYSFYYIPISMSICECENGISTIIENQVQRMSENELIVNGKISFKAKILFKLIPVKLFMKSIVRFIYPSYFSDANKRKRLLRDPRIFLNN